MNFDKKIILGSYLHSAAELDSKRARIARDTMGRVGKEAVTTSDAALLEFEEPLSSVKAGSQFCEGTIGAAANWVLSDNAQINVPHCYFGFSNV